jgi:putative ABC transport system permease protein
MFRLTITRLAATRRRLLGTVLSVVLGVAFLSGTLLLGNTLEANFTRLFSEAIGSTDVVVRGAVDVSTRPQQGQSRVPASLVDVVRHVDGVARAEPQWQGYAQLIGADGKAVGGNGPPTIGGNWIDDPDLNPYRLAEGRAPAADDEVVVNRGALRAAGLSLGQRVTVRTPEPLTATIVGVATFGDTDGMGPATFTGFTESEARAHVVANAEQVSAILVKADGGVGADELATRIGAALPAGSNAEAVTGAQLAAENVSQLGEAFLNLLRTFLLVFSAIALLVATVTIYNTFSIVVAQRTREAALLRAIGATRGQVLRSGLIESAVLGLAASAVGVVAGIGVAQLLKVLFSLAGSALPSGGLAFSWRDAVVAFVVGVAVTLVAGTAPALRASAVAPLEALRSTAVESRTLRNRTVAGLVLMVVAAAVLVAGISGASAVVVAGGSLALLVGLLVVAPIIVRGLSRALRRPLDRTRGLTGAMAAENAARNPRRTASTASALLVGVGVVTLITVAASSLGASTRGELSRRLRADVVVSTGQWGGGGLSPTLVGALAQRPEVGTAMGIGSGAALVGGTGRELSVIDPAAIDRVIDLGRVDGSVADLGPRSLAVARDVADAEGLAVGRDVPVTFADGAQEQWRIGAVFDGQDTLKEMLVGREAWAPHALQDVDQLVLVTTAPGVEVADLQQAAAAASSGFGAPQVLDRAAFVEQRTAFVDRLLTVVYAMLALAIVIALMGIGTTLSLAIHERARELGLLRAVGQTRSQVRSMVRWESAVIAVFGTGAGAALGLVLGWALVRAMASESMPTVLSVPGGRLAAVVVVAAGAGVLAAVRPARRAAKVDVLEALGRA